MIRNINDCSEYSSIRKTIVFSEHHFTLPFMMALQTENKSNLGYEEQKIVIKY